MTETIIKSKLIEAALDEADRNAEDNKYRLSHEDVFSCLRGIIRKHVF